MMKSKVIALTAIFITLISLVIWALNSEKEQGNEMSLLQRQPVFSLKIEGFGSLYFITVNGVTVFRQYRSGADVNTTLPINHYMRSGDNEIRISTWSGNDNPITPHARVKVNLMVNDFSTPDDSYVVTNIDYHNNVPVNESAIKNSTATGRFDSVQGFIADENGDVIVDAVIESIDDNVFEFVRNVTISSSLPLWAFFNSDELPDYHEMTDNYYYKTMDILFPYYQRLQDAIDNKDIDALMPMFAERNRELDAAFYNEPGALEQRLKEALLDAATDDTATLVELAPKYLNFLVQENNQLVSLSRRQAGPAVSLDYNERNGSYSFDMIFRKQDGEWILTR